MTDLQIRVLLLVFSKTRDFRFQPGRSNFLDRQLFRFRVERCYGQFLSV